MKLKLTQLSSLEKVFLSRPVPENEYASASVLKGEEFAYQIAYRTAKDDGHKQTEEECIGKTEFEVEVDSPLKEHISVYDIGNVPGEMTAYSNADDNYITKDAGLFPDVLNKLRGGCVDALETVNRAVWINIDVTEDTPAGGYPITVIFKNDELGIKESRTFNIEVIDAVLPEQKLIFTQWFHGDCIAEYYGEEVFSETHWTHMENFIKTAAKNGINMLLTPIFTPPLDTAVGGERPTIQLVDICLSNGNYSFGFDKLKRWIDICRNNGIKYFEMAHLFTQWGAKCTPKIIAEVDGVKKRIFGWDVEACSEEYKNFLGQFLPALTEFLKDEGVAENTMFHISDEPMPEHMESYTSAAAIAKPYLKDFKIVDALSSYEFYKSGAVEHPIPSINHIKPFLGIKDLWTYYCCAQGVNVANRFFAMPSYRNRIIGLQLYKYDIKGFLQWGYNFYYAQCSKYLINPYLVTDAGGAYPSGDAFSVYPGADGTAVESLRLKVFLHALQDMRAMELLETVLGKDEIIKMMDADEAVEIKSYPHSAGFILNFRESINKMIKEKLVK